MKRFLCLLPAALFFACPNSNSPGIDAGDEEPPLEIAVSGTASVFPQAAGWMADAGQPLPALEGLTLRVEEPLRVVQGDPDAVFGSMLLPTDGTFSIGQVFVDRVNVGIAAGIRDESDAGVPRVIRAATVVWDVGLEKKRPSDNISGSKAFAIPTAYHQQLTAAVGASNIQARTAGQHSTLIGAGFILGQVVDAAGVPVQGAKVAPETSEYTAGFYYPKADLSGTQDSTSANGLFVFVHRKGETPDVFDFSIEGRPEYLKRQGGSAGGAGVVVIVYPGQTPPP